MKKLNLILAKLGFFIFLVFNTFVQADELISKNISVIDGDTIILENKKIRFSGIDAPESFFRGKKQTCLLNSIKIFCGEVSKEKLEKKIANKIVKCIPEKEKDFYNRILAECFINGSESLSIFMVKNGYAFDYPRYSKKRFATFQKFAKENKLGLWKMKFEFPWIWRKKNR